MSVLNPAELHRECVRLERQNELLEARLSQKEADLQAAYNEVRKTEAAKTSLTAELAKLQKEKSNLSKQVLEKGKLCQELIQERDEWRPREQRLVHQLEDMQTRCKDLQRHMEVLQAQCVKADRTISEQDRQIQEHLEKRTQLIEAQTPRRAATCIAATQTDLEIDDLTRRWVEVDAMAAVGFSEAKSNKVEVQQLRRRVARLEASTERANEACNAYKSGCEALQQEVQHLSAELSTARQEQQEERRTLLAKIKAAESREKDLHLSIETLRKRDLSVEEARREVDQLGGKAREQLRAENSALKAELGKLQDELQNLREEHTKNQEKYLQLMNVLQQHRVQADDHRRQTSEEIQALNQENAEVIEDYNRIRQHRDELKADLQKREKELLVAKDTLLRAQEQHAKDLQSIHQRSASVPTSQPPNAKEHDLAEEVILQRKHADSLQQFNSQLAQQIQQLLKEVSELRRVQHSPPSPLTRQLEQLQKSLDTQTAKQEVDTAAFTAQIKALEEELARKDKIISQLHHGSPVVDAASTDPDPAPNVEDPAKSPPTRLQALLHTISMDKQGPLPSLSHRDPAEEPTQDSESQLCLESLCSKLKDMLKLAHTTAMYLHKQTGSPEAEALNMGIPITFTTAFMNPMWNKAFELVSAIKHCYEQAQHQVTFVVTQNIILRRHVTNPDTSSAQHMGNPQPPPYPTHLPRDFHSPAEPMQGSTPSLDPTMMPAMRPPDVHERSVSGPPAGPPADGDDIATESDGSNQGEDLAYCTQVINDNDTLLRAAQGVEPFWGDERIEQLQHELMALQGDPVDCPVYHQSSPPRMDTTAPQEPIRSALPRHEYINTPPPRRDEMTHLQQPSERRSMYSSSGSALPPPPGLPPPPQAEHSEAEKENYGRPPGPAARWGVKKQGGSPRRTMRWGA